jgi:acetyl esterase
MASTQMDSSRLGDFPEVILPAAHRVESVDNCQYFRRAELDAGKKEARHMDRKLSRVVVGLDSLASLVMIGFLSAILCPLRGFSQAAGAGSENPKNLPGYAPKPSAPPQLPKPVTDPQVKAVLDQMAAAGVLHPTTLEQWRKAYLFYAKFAGAPEKVFHVEDRAIPGPGGNIPIRLYVPRDGTGLPVWVFFHGGGFVTGSLDTHDVPLRAVANRCDCLVVSVAYRLAPENHYPAATNDAYAATKWVADHAAEIGGDAGRIAVGGDGAGGNLASVVALMAHDQAGPHLIYQVLIYPTLDLTMLSPSRIVANDPVFTTDAMLATTSTYVPVNTDLELPYLSPVDAKSFQGLPAALIITDEDDPVRDEAERYASELKSAGIHVDLSRYPNMIHGFFLMAGALDAGKQSIDQVGAALKQAFKNAN